MTGTNRIITAALAAFAIVAPVATAMPSPDMSVAPGRPRHRSRTNAAPTRATRQ
jgi:hypothetical protein